MHASPTGAQPPVDAFDKGVLRRLAQCDVVPVDFAFVGEGEDRVRGELGAPPQENGPPNRFKILLKPPGTSAAWPC